MAISLSTVLTVVAAAEQAVAVAQPLVSDAFALYEIAAPGLSASDQATAQAALAKIQLQNTTDFTRVDKELQDAEGQGGAA